MGNILLILALLLIGVTNSSAHTLILNSYANPDDTVTIEGKFDTGATATGALVLLESTNTDKELYRQRMPRESELTVKIPKEPYRIVLDGGPGHRTTQAGVPPKGGFSVQPQKGKPAADQHKNSSWSLPLTVTIGLAFALLFVTLWASSRNTARLLQAVSEKPS